jgi:hypothetical protein
MSHEGYCVRCKKKRKMKDVKKIKMRNGRRRLSGRCSRCGTKMSKFIRSKK